MNDFLLSLVERAGNRAPVLQRRQRALFEPATPQASVERESDSHIEEVEAHRPVPAQSPVHERLIVMRESSRTPAPPVKPIESLRAMPALAVPTITNTPPASERSERVGSAPQRGILQSPITPPALLAPRIDVRAVDAPAASLRSAPSPTEPARAERAVTKLQRQLPDPAFIADARGRNESKNALAVPLARLVESPAPMKSPARAQHVASRRETAPAVLLARAQTSAKAAPAPAPAPAPVHISIGRVEVRASAAPQTRTRAQTPAAPRLTLDEYLRGRNGGVR